MVREGEKAQLLLRIANGMWIAEDTEGEGEAYKSWILENITAMHFVNSESGGRRVSMGWRGDLMGKGREGKWDREGANFDTGGCYCLRGSARQTLQGALKKKCESDGWSCSNILGGALTGSAFPDL